MEDSPYWTFLQSEFSRGRYRNFLRCPVSGEAHRAWWHLPQQRPSWEHRFLSRHGFECKTLLLQKRPGILLKRKMPPFLFKWVFFFVLAESPLSLELSWKLLLGGNENIPIKTQKFSSKDGLFTFKNSLVWKHFPWWMIHFIKSCVP